MMKNYKRELIKYSALVYSDKFVIGAGGNISLRKKNKVYIKASGVSLGDSKQADYNEINLDTGRISCFSGPCSIEVPMHLACYKARPDIGAVIHTHPIYGTIAGIIGGRLGYISYEFMLAMKSEVPAVAYKKAGTHALAAAVGKGIKNHNGILLKNHGIIVVGADMGEAYHRTLALERACKIYVLAKLAGKVSFISATELRAGTGATEKL